ncbi:retropepsin-like aspartic protease [Alteromonas flava]|uniref:retropepsin-like aspartic protease n=1 Tax=Alteromonas flava TaxID=2048003 RepID=UPI000C2840EE|nr:retropepsin-like aspartic protease [Alteromonas flava]
MSLGIRFVIAALIASLALNLYLLFFAATPISELTAITAAPNQTNSERSIKPSTEVLEHASQPVALLADTDTQEGTSAVTRSTLSLADLNAYFRDEDWPQLTIALREYLRDNPNDLDAHLLEAEMIARTKPLNVALVNFYTLLDKPFDADVHASLQEKIEQLFENATEQLRFDRAWDLLAELLEPLVQIAPNERRYLILLAEAYAQQANEVMMENALAGLPFDDPAADAVRQILARKQIVDTDASEIASSEALAEAVNFGRATRIPLERIGNQYMLELSMDNNPVKLMIDTGASTTAITTRAWSQLSRRVAAKYIGIFRVNTAAGYIQAPMFSIKSVQLGPLQFDDVSVMVIPSRMMGDDPTVSPQGLLGMNILSQYNFQIDQQNAVLLLRKRTNS